MFEQRRHQIEVIIPQKQPVVKTGNNAKAYSSTMNVFVDQFGKFATYKVARKYTEIAADMETLWSKNPLMAVRMIFGIRMITRDHETENGKIKGKGGELKNEGMYRMMWLGINHKEVFERYLPLYICIASWKDVFTMLKEDLVFHGWEKKVLPWNYIGQIILEGLNSKSQTDLVKKYLPQIRAKSKIKNVNIEAKTIIAKWIASLITKSPNTYEVYRKIKSSGTAHEWQQLISKKRFNEIDFDKIHGRALQLLVKSKFLKNHGLEYEFKKFITSEKVISEGAKATDFVHDLFRDLKPTDTIRRLTTDAQFKTLVNKAKDSKSERKILVVRDISGSMNSPATGLNMSSGNVAKALALYFSELLEGKFKNSYMVFASRAEMRLWNGGTPTEKWFNDTEDYYGSTNFESAIDTLIKQKEAGIPEEEFPNCLLCISDGEFNPTNLNQTNVEHAYMKLRSHFTNDFVNNFVIVLWNIPNQYYGRDSVIKFESHSKAHNVFYFSGYSPSIISFLNNMKVTNAEELLDEFLNQPILKLINKVK